MNSNNSIYEIRSLLQNSDSFLIALAERTDEDATAAALALYLVLTKAKKQADIVSSSDIKVEMSHLYGVNKISKMPSGGNSLVVSLPYEEGTIEKVSYNIEGNKLNLVVEPRGDKLSFNPNDIEYNYGRSDHDTIFAIGAKDLSSLGSVYTKHKHIFRKGSIINIDNQQENTRYGKVNLVNKGSVSQTVAILLQSLRIPIEADPASNLYTGIVSVEKNVTVDSLQPEVLETIAFLLRSNARNLKKKETKQQEHVMIQEKRSREKKQTLLDREQGGKKKKEGKEAPEDWLKPKIFTTDNRPS